MGGLAKPLDVAWRVPPWGRPASTLDARNSRLAVGPLVGALTGTLKVFDDGFRIDLAWQAGPVPCRAFELPPPAGAPFDIAYQLRKLSESVGMTKIDGQVSARASLAFDSRDLGIARLDFLPEAKCPPLVVASADEPALTYIH